MEAVTGICCFPQEFIAWIMFADREFFFLWDHKFLLVCLQQFIGSLGNHCRQKSAGNSAFYGEFVWISPHLALTTQSWRSFPQSFPFWISFFCVLLFLFHFQPSSISKDLFIFPLCFWLQQFLYFPASQPKFRDPDAKISGDFLFDIESSGAAEPNNWNFLQPS